jgi:hypothetical protein
MYISYRSKECAYHRETDWWHAILEDRLEAVTGYSLEEA